MRTLIIVESPTKAKAVAELARPVIEGQVSAWACLGHLRDLPPDELGVAIADGFRPEYVVIRARTKTLEALREKVLQADRVILATDPDREGEAVAWHVAQALKPELQGKPCHRATFNAITAAAVQRAMQDLRPLDHRLVQAAIARRVLDRLVGYVVSPALWRAIKGRRGLSAGRVQTAALRLLVEYEREAEALRSRTTWTVEAEI